MPRDNPYRPFVPDPAQMALRPDTSGNEINGLGEKCFSRPRMVYWAPDPADIAHGSMQEWFYTVDPGLPVFAELRAKRQEISQRVLPEIAETPAVHSPAAWTAQLEEFVTEGLCEQIGVAQMQPEWVYQHREEVTQSRVIIVGVQHDYDTIATAPDPEAGAEVMQQYYRAAACSVEVASWLRRKGWDAKPVTGPMVSAITMIPPAIACGFGELGKHGSIINREMGASFRLSAVLTDAPFAPTPPRSHGIDDFCANCRICEDACPPEALFQTKKMVRGRRNGMWISTSACRFSISIRGVRFASRFALGHARA
ncbi:(Fe-S)-binding protein [Sulfitobacter aestuariivivens]|uniref:(Fe-S)-binding protein n=1 Tax=Sulfitobacter aestuariivivens TaxID=2766981 RepID=UPI0036130B4F